MIFEKIKNGKYDYPERPKKPVPPVFCKNGHKLPRIFSNFPKFCPECGCKNDFHKKMKKYKEEIKKWREKCNRIDERFKKDFLKYFEMENHPKADIFFKRCWEYGHSSGLQEVVNYGVDLEDLVK